MLVVPTAACHEAQPSSGRVLFIVSILLILTAMCAYHYAHINQSCKTSLRRYLCAILGRRLVKQVALCLQINQQRMVWVNRFERPAPVSTINILGQC